MLTGISQVLSRSSTLEPKWSTYTRGCIVFNHVLVFFRSRHLRCQQCMRRFGSVKGLSMHYAAAHGPTFQCFWCQYTVESRRFDNLKRHAHRQHSLQLANLLDEYPTFKAAYKNRFPALFPRIPRKSSVPQPPTAPIPPEPLSPRLTLPMTPIVTPVTDTISLDEEISKFMEMGSFGQEKNSVNLPSSSLNTPTLPMLSPDPPTLTTSPPPEIFQPTFTQESALEPLDLSVTIANSTESPISPPPTVTQTSTPQSDQKGYLAALMDSHRDRALSSSNMVKVVSSEHTMETVEEEGFKYFRLVTILKGH